MKNSAILAALLALPAAASAQTLIVPLTDTREVTAEAYEGQASSPLQQDSQTISASGFGSFDEVASASVTSPGGFGDAFASMDSDIGATSMTFVGSAAGNGSQLPEFCSDAYSRGVVTFEVTAPCAFRFHGFVEGYDNGYAWAYLNDDSGGNLGGKFGVFIGVKPFDDTGFLQPGIYSVEVRGNGGLCGNSYASTNYSASLELTPFTSEYCAATPNSSGAAASLGVMGSPSLTANDLVLQGVDGPPGQFSLFLYGTTQAAMPLGNGTLCLANPFIRLGDVSAISATGKGEFAFDFTSAALSTGAGAIQAGSTWNFQWIFRDAGGAGLNLSRGLTVTFYP